MLCVKKNIQNLLTYTLPGWIQITSILSMRTVQLSIWILFYDLYGGYNRTYVYMGYKQLGGHGQRVNRNNIRLRLKIPYTTVSTVSLRNKKHLYTLLRFWKQAWLTLLNIKNLNFFMSAATSRNKSASFFFFFFNQTISDWYTTEINISRNYLHQNLRSKLLKQRISFECQFLNLSVN